MRRRKFLTVLGGISLAALAAGCQSVPADSLKIAMLENSVPPQLIQAFKRQLSESETVSVIPANSLLKLYEMLQGWQRQTQDHPAQNTSETATPLQPVANWLTLGDYWLQSAIQQGLIQPVNINSLKHWDELPGPWTELLRRDSTGALSKTGEIWGVPYRWSSLAILYDPSKLARNASLNQWEDLLRPELNRRVVLPDHPRLVIGLGLKAVGASANIEDPTQVHGLVDFLKALHQQVRFYSSDYYLETLIIGDASAVVGWTEEMQSTLKQYRQYSGVVPAPGTLVGADLWVQPKTAETVTFSDAWPNFCLSSEFADLLASYSQGASPRWFGSAPDQLPTALQQHPLFSPPAAIQANSDFLLPLSDAANARYRELWTSLRELT